MAVYFRSLEVRWRFFCILSFAAGPALAVSSINELCPGAIGVLSSVSFPLDVAANVNRARVEIDLTVRTDGSVGDAIIHSASEPSFEHRALQAVSKLSCSPQPSERRFRLPVDFTRPAEMTSANCPNYQSVVRSLGFPRAAYDKGYLSGKVLIDFKMDADGEIPEFYVIRSTDETFAKTALHALAQLKCTGLGHEARVRVPFEFRLE